ncbi:MAG: hypothetical protein ACYSO7_00985 [Planctomycetota bacterium]|jgi:hypothetical protein
MSKQVLLACSLLFIPLVPSEKRRGFTSKRERKMETVINNENRNELVKKVISGEVPVEKATIGLARVEVKIFYRKLDRASQTMSSQQSQFISDISVFNNNGRPANSYAFPIESLGPFRIYTKFKALVA